MGFPVNRRFPKVCTVTLFMCLVKIQEGFLFLLVCLLVYLREALGNKTLVGGGVVRTNVVVCR